MAKLKTRTQCYGGFYFRDPQINTTAQLHDWAFNTLCVAVQRQRAANARFGLSTDMGAIENEVESQNVARLMALGSRVSDQYVMEGGVSPPSFQPAASPRPHLSAVAGQVAKVIKNSGVLVDWLGSGGKPVEREIAESRAKVCLDCPRNQVGDLPKWFLIPAVNAIQRALEMRNDLKLDTPHDGQLGVCDVCLCSNRLKIWTPIEHIKGKSSDEVLSELRKVVNPAGGCWITKEIQ
jgi:hypothetical protein